MRAWRVDRYGEPADVLRLDAQAPEPAPAEGSVLLAVRTVGLNFADTLSIRGRYQIKAPPPFSPGIEGCGVVVAGDGTLRAGSRVVFSVPYGALAEQIRAAPSACLPIPDALGDEEAAALLVTYQTSHFALVRRARLRQGELLLVHNGAGGVGTAAIQIAKAIGAVVVATAGGQEKLEVCRRAGADLVVDYRQEDFAAAVLDRSDGRGADVVYDSVGGDVFDASLRCLAFEGRLIVVGFAGGRIPTVAANRIMLKNVSVVGLNWGSYRDDRPDLVAECHRDICARIEGGALRPVLYRTYPFDDLLVALGDLESRRSYGKLVVRVQGGKGP